MNKRINIILVGLVFLAGLFVSSAVYTVNETQQVIVTQFGKLIGKPITKAGLNFKLPWQTVNYFEKRILQWDGDANQMPTRDKRFIWVDTTARWRIIDPLKFMQSVRNEISAQSRLDDLIDASTRAIISGHILVEAIRNDNSLIEETNLDKEKVESDFWKTALVPIKKGREKLAEQIRERAAASMPVYGIELVDVKIKRINYVEDVRKEVYGRMIEERRRASEKFRSEGKGKKAEIEGQILKELKEIESNAYRTAQIIVGEADAEAIKIYAKAYNNDPEFYSFLKTLESYRKTINKDTVFILSTKNEFYKQLNGVGKSVQ